MSGAVVGVMAAQKIAAAGGTPAVVQNATGAHNVRTNAGTTAVVNPIADPTTGNAVLFLVHIEDLTTTVSSISDGTNTYTEIAGPHSVFGSSPAHRIYWFLATNITGFAGNITVTVSASTNFEVWMWEASDLVASSTLEQSGVTTRTATSTPTAAFTLTHDKQLVLAYSTAEGGTTCTADPTTTAGATGPTVSFLPMYEVFTTAGAKSIDPTYSSSDWVRISYITLKGS